MILISSSGKAEKCIRASEEEEVSFELNEGYPDNSSIPCKSSTFSNSGFGKTNLKSGERRVHFEESESLDQRKEKGLRGLDQ